MDRSPELSRSPSAVFWKVSICRASSEVPVSRSQCWSSPYNSTEAGYVVCGTRTSYLENLAVLTLWVEHATLKPEVSFPCSASRCDFSSIPPTSSSAQFCHCIWNIVLSFCVLESFFFLKYQLPKDRDYICLVYLCALSSMKLLYWICSANVSSELRG